MMAIAVPKFSLRSLLLVVAVAAIGFAFCVQWPVHETRVTMTTTSGRWLFIDWTSTGPHVEEIARRPDFAELAIRTGVFSLIAVCGITVLAEHRKSWHTAFAILLLCFAMSFMFATSWVIVMTMSLPRTDMAFGEMPFQDPLIFPIMSVFASIAAILVFPFTYFALRNRRLPRATGILMAVVFAEIAIVTPLDAGLGFIGSFVAYSIGLVLAVKFQPASPRQVVEEVPEQ